MLGGGNSTSKSPGHRSTLPRRHVYRAGSAVVRLSVVHQRWLVALRDLVRWRDWSESKLPIFLVGMSYAVLVRRQPAIAEAGRLVALFLLLCLYAAFGHIANDYADRDVDRAAGKRRILASWSEPVALLAMTAPALAAVGIAWTCFDAATVSLTLLAIAVAAVYSLPPARLKVRGILGWISATLAQRTLPMVIVFQALQQWDVAAVALGVVSVPIGLRFIVAHQLQDRANDLRTGVRTVATERDPRQLIRLLRAVALIEIVCLGAAVAAMSFVEPVVGAVALVYAASLAVSRRRRLKYLPPGALFLFDFYCETWPITLGVLLTARSLWFLPVLLLALALTQREAKLAAVARIKAALHLGTVGGHAPSAPPAPAPAPGMSRPIASAISAGIAALARMQDADGSFPLLVATDPRDWRPCGRLFSTAYIMLGGGALLPAERIAQALRFIASQRRPDGLWEYDPALRIPPDADSTACALAALALRGGTIPDVAGAAGLLRSFWRGPDGPFRSWNAPGMWSLPERDDPVANCNILLALRCLGSPGTPAEAAAVVRLIERTDGRARYYCGSGVVAYAAGKAELDPAALPPRAVARPVLKDPLGCVHWLCATATADSELVAALVAAQRPDGSWPLLPWVTGAGNPQPYWSSPAIITALVLEALSAVSRRYAGRTDAESAGSHGPETPLARERTAAPDLIKPGVDP